MDPTLGFLLTGVLPLIVIIATIVWAARVLGRNVTPTGIKDVPRRIWLVFLAEFVALGALMIWAYR